MTSLFNMLIFNFSGLLRRLAMTCDTYCHFSPFRRQDISTLLNNRAVATIRNDVKIINKK